MIERKYNSYQVSIEYLNKDKEIINYKEKDARSYKQVLELYKETKDFYSNENTCVKINFCGITESNNINIIFTKEIINTEDLQIKQKADEFKEKSVADITNDILQNLDMLLEKSKKLNESLSILNKKEDVQLHKIEAIKYPTDACKLQIYDDISTIRTERRITKNELTLLGVLNINDIKNQILRTKKAENTMVKTENKIIDNGLENYVFVKEIKYRNFKELPNLVEQLKTKYDKVSYSESDMIIYCYNNNGCKYNHKKKSSVIDIKKVDEVKNVETTPTATNDEYKIMKVVRFKTYPEKITLMMKLQREYTKVIADDIKMTLTCKNKII
jgi:hypothetical protein